MPAWVVLLVGVGLVVTFVSWLLLNDSLVRIGPGHLGLLLIKGKATDRVLPPGPHFQPAFRRRVIAVYPSLELSYRAGDVEAAEASDTEFENGGPPLAVLLGDRTAATISYTVRFRIDPGQLRAVHERFGSQGLWAVVRDRSGRVLRDALCQESVGVEDLYGAARLDLEERLRGLVSETLATEGFEVTMFGLNDADVGRTGEVIQATVRARLDLVREEAEAATRRARARNDAALEGIVGAGAMEAALRYREVDAWREVAQALVDRTGMIPAPITRPAGDGAAKEPSSPAAADVDETSEQ